MSKKNQLPLKSVAVTLLFCVFLGPIGVLYSSVLGGVVMMATGILMLRAKLMGPIWLLLWMISCVWGVVATNRYNNKMIKLLS